MRLRKKILMNVGEIKYYSHSSKTKCVFVDNKELPLICIDVWCKAGSSFEQKHKNGSAHLLEHMIFKGSNTIMPGEFDYKIESLGGISNASTGYDDAHYYVLIPSINFKESLALLTNLVLTPSININEFNLEKTVVIDEIKQQNDQPDEKLFNYFLSRVWISEYYKSPILGNEKDIELLKIHDLEKFHRYQYNHENICLAIAGNLSNYIYDAVEETNISYISNSLKLDDNNKNKSLIIRQGREEITFKNIKFSRIFMAWDIPALKNQKDIIGLEILATILSVGRNSRLVKNLKEENNLVESIYIDINAGELGGLLILEACCDKDKLKTVEANIYDVINEIKDYKNISSSELNKAKNIVKSNYVFNLETSPQLASFFGNELLWGRKNSIKDLETNIEFWNNKERFKEILKYISKKNFTLIAIEDS